MHKCFDYYFLIKFIFISISFSSEVKIIESLFIEFILIFEAFISNAQKMKMLQTFLNF